MDRLVFTWVTLFTATSDTFDPFYVACNSISERYLSFSFWHFFFSKKMELYIVLQWVIMSRYELETYQMISIDTGYDVGTT